MRHRSHWVGCPYIPDLTHKHHDVSIGIAYPAFAVISPWVHVRLLQNVSVQSARPRHRLVKPAHLKPEEHAEPGRRAVRIAEIGMTMRIPSMKLQNDFPISNDLFVFGASVAALAIEQLLLPPAASLDVSHGNERLSSHHVLPSSLSANFLSTLRVEEASADPRSETRRSPKAAPTWKNALREKFTAAKVVNRQHDALKIVPPNNWRNLGIRLPHRRCDLPEDREAVVIVERLSVVSSHSRLDERCVVAIQ